MTEDNWPPHIGCEDGLYMKLLVHIGCTQNTRSDWIDLCWSCIKLDCTNYVQFCCLERPRCLFHQYYKCISTSTDLPELLHHLWT